jgi:hypothetical protein
MKKPLKIYAGIIALLVLQSCGMVTKTRYGNGLKLNLGIRNEKENPQVPNRFAKSNLKPQVNLNFSSHADIPFENLKPVSSLKTFPKNKSKSFKTNTVLMHSKSKTSYLKEITLKKNYKILEPSKTKKKIEPHVKIGGILFYASILGSIIMSLFPIPLLASILGLSLLAGIVLTLVGKRFMKKNPDQFRGNGLLWSVLITCSVFLLLTFINLAFFIVAVA